LPIDFLGMGRVLEPLGCERIAVENRTNLFLNYRLVQGKYESLSEIDS
jgi:hypothetical protein